MNRSEAAARRERLKQQQRVKEQNRRTDLKDHEDKQFLTAKAFVLRRFDKNNQRDDLEVRSFIDALHEAIWAIKKGYRVLIYAVPILGANIVLVPDRWNDYLKLWHGQYGQTNKDKAITPETPRPTRNRRVERTPRKTCG